MKKAKEKTSYHASTLDKGLEVLETLQQAHDPLRVLDVVNATMMERAAVFRMLCTLENRGYIKRLPDKRYVAVTRSRRPRLGYIAPLSGTSFRTDVARGMQDAAGRANLELIVIESNNEDPASSLPAVEKLLEADVNLVVMFQPLDSMAHVLADRFIAAGLPVISIETPLAGALYFGGNSYQAGLLAGDALGRHARREWNGEFDKIILLESTSSPPENRARLSGTVERMRELLGDFPESLILQADGRGSFEESRAACARLLKGLAPRSRILVSAFNDRSAIGALHAVTSVRRDRYVAIVGQNGTAESRAELVKPKSALIASVAYFPEKYGESIVDFATAVMRREKTPLARYTTHVLLNHANVSQFYPGVDERPLADKPRLKQTIPVSTKGRRREEERVHKPA